MKKGILAKLSGNKGNKPEQSLDSASITVRYPTFNDICAAVGNDSTEGAKLLHAIITDIKLFHRYTSTPDKLKTLVTMCPNRIDDIIQIISSDPDSERRFLTGVDTLVEMNAFFKLRKGPQYKDDLVKHALTNHRVYSQLFISEHQLEEALRLLPQFQGSILEILVNDITIFNKCVGRLPFYCEFCKKHEKYRARFVSLAYTSERVYEALDLFNKQYFVEFAGHFPEAEQPLINFICADAKRFNDAFGTFTSIYDFCEKYPQHAHHLERLFEQAISTDGYVKHNISSINRLVEVYNHNPAHAERLESMVLADPKWLLEMMDYSEDVQILSNHKAFGRIKEAFFALYYSNLINFRRFAGSEARLEKMIYYAPDQEFKLRLYYQLHIKQTPITEIIKTQYKDVATVLELKQHIQNCIKQGSMPLDTLKVLREQINSILDFTEESASYYTALNELKECLDHNLSPKVASLLHKGILTEKTSAKDKGDTTQLVQPDSPDRLSNN